MHLSELIASHSLSGAIEQLKAALRAQPGSADLRAHLTQLLCLTGDWPGALAQLKAWRTLAPEAESTVRLLQRMIEGELAREQVFLLEAAPAVLPQGCDLVVGMARALHTPDERESLLAHLPANGGWLTRRAAPEAAEAFDWLADGDERLGPVCELILDGVYYWVGLHAIAQIRFQPPTSVVDLIWRQCSVRLRDGSEQLAQIPARYPLRDGDSDAHKLTRQTSWSLRPQGYTGHGQRIWLDGDQEWALLDLESVTFQEPA